MGAVVAETGEVRNALSIVLDTPWPIGTKHADESPQPVR